MDYYNLLNVKKSATAEEIKKSYRSLAMKHHPDRGGDPDTFKNINEAYDILGSVSKRAAYDIPPNNHQFNSQNFTHPYSPFEQAFNQHGFGHGFAQRTVRNKDVVMMVTLDLRDTLTGKNLIIQYRLAGGELETVTVAVPAGAKNGDTIRYQSLGDNGHPDYPRGDLHVKVRVNNAQGWERDADHLITKKQVNVFDLILGGVILVSTLEDKKLEIKIPRGTKPGQTFSVTGHGVPNINTGRRGNLYVEINAEIPKITNEQLIDEIILLRNKINKQ
jgi:curved DNA-binding protein